MNILLSTDNNYVMPTGVLMHSICINNPGDVAFHVMVNELFSKESKNDLTDIAHQYGKEIHYYTITEEMTKELPVYRDDMRKDIPIATYYRLFITTFLPTEVHKIIYLDGDMIVRLSLDELWNTDLDGYAVGAVNDMAEKIHIKQSSLPYPLETGYFNAGMLLINVDYWREHDCLGQFMKFVREHGDCIKCHDQDVMNAVLYDKKKWLSTTYNLQPDFLRNPDNYAEAIYDEIGRTMQNPVIIHYSAPSKPWMYLSFSPYTRVWRHYKSLSKWKNMNLMGPIGFNPKKWLLAFLFQNNLWKCKCDRLKSKLKS